ncbi:hypothetical protein KTC96_24760 (plasmid) [Clostridium estertheticum]|uniref:hypothetical protein n=1 Tax=Clostridium estertheticum TaxID=238834 RepID=UPI001C7D5FDE|nr:hypothetical protein [Clostridium estertheticum]MBX4259740.1 hypothetical protein [Clostridium estertheticum]WLC73327.1 hypothetical protein KTC96_24760 [Clostridium estertheticum]
MLKVLANKILGFTNGDRDKKGNLIVIKTKIGFCELPNWVEETKYYDDACKDGSLRAFESAASSEEVLKEQEKLQLVKDEIKAAEEKRDLLNTTNQIIEKELKASNSKSKSKAKE